MSTEPVDLGVVIVSYNTRDLLDTCLASLADELAGLELAELAELAELPGGSWLAIRRRSSRS